MTDDSGRRSAVGGRRSAVGGQMTEDSLETDARVGLKQSAPSALKKKSRAKSSFVGADYADFAVKSRVARLIAWKKPLQALQPHNRSHTPTHIKLSRTGPL
ncbi:MAG: hypothetical protein JEZ11_25485 [Desulfobacterales bacterium]|nr:hypothetical protein [Desulfobacterales bacterium]